MPNDYLIEKKDDINGKKVRVLHAPPLVQGEQGEVADIQVLMTPQERHQFLRTTPDKHTGPMESCVTYNTQQHFAEYKGKEDIRHRESGFDATRSVSRRYGAMDDIHGLTTCFIPLEPFVNNALYDTHLKPKKTLNDLLALITSFDDKIKAKMEAMHSQVVLNKRTSDPAAQKELKKIWEDAYEYKLEVAGQRIIHSGVKARIDAFKAQIEALINKNPSATPAEVEALFEIQNTSMEWSITPTEQTLDTFMRGCMDDVLTAGISTVHAIKEENLWKRFKSHWWESASGKALSRAKDDNREALSVLGVIERGTHKTPQSQLDALTEDAPPAVTDTDKKKWQPLKNYCTDWSFLSLDSVLCAATDQKLEERKKPSLGYDARKWVSAVPEIGYSGVRLAFEAVGFVGYGLLYTLESTAAGFIYTGKGIGNLLPSSKNSASAGKPSRFERFYQECLSHDALSEGFSEYHKALSDAHKSVSTHGIRVPFTSWVIPLTQGMFYSQDLWDKQYKRNTANIAPVVNNDADETRADNTTILSPLASETTAPVADANDSKTLSETAETAKTDKTPAPTKDPHQTLLEAVNPTNNWLHKTMDRADPVEGIKYLAASLWSVAQAGSKFLQEFYYNPPQLWITRKTIEDRKQEKLKKNQWVAEQLDLMEQFLDTLKEPKKAPSSVNNNAINNSADTVASNSGNGENKEAAQVQTAQIPAAQAEIEYDEYASVKGVAETNIANPYKVANEVFVVLKKVIEEGFKEAPGPATLFCTVALVSLASGFGVVPLAGKTMHAAASGLQVPTKWIAAHAMGQSYNESMTAKLFSAFLEYKMAYFGTQGAKAILIDNDTEFFQRIMKDPAQFIVGSVICIALGTGIAHLPQIPSFTISGTEAPSVAAYKGMMNGMITEGHEALNGDRGLRGMEIGFIGLKSFLFLKSLVSGNIFKDQDEKKLAAIFLLMEELRILRKNKGGSGAAVTVDEWTDIFNQNKYSCFSEEEQKAIKDKYHTIFDTVKPVDLSEKATPEEELEAAEKQYYKEMDRMAKKPEVYTVAGNSKEHYFNYMDSVVERYNRALCAVGRDNEEKNKPKIMAEVGTHLYGGSPNVIRISFFAIPIYVGAVLFRLYKSPVEWYNRLRGIEPSPYKVYQVNKSFHKDAVNVVETLAAVGGSFLDGCITAVQYVSRGVLGTVLYVPIVAPIAALTFAINNTWLRKSPPKDKLTWANNVARFFDNTILRHIRLPNTNTIGKYMGFRKLARWSAKVATTSSDIQGMAEKEMMSDPKNLASTAAISGLIGAAPLTGNQDAENPKQEPKQEELESEQEKPKQSTVVPAVQPSSVPTPKSKNVSSFFQNPTISTLPELSKQRKTQEQKDILQRLARNKSGADGAKMGSEDVASQIGKLPEEWQGVVRGNYCVA